MEEVKVLNRNRKHELRRFLVESISSIFFVFIAVISFCIYYEVFPITKKNLGITIAIVFLLFIILFFIKMISINKSKVILIINKNGIIHKELFEFIPWNDIKRIKLYRYGWLKDLVGMTLEIVNIEEKINALPEEKRSIVMFNYKKGNPLIKIEGFLTPEIEEIYDLLSSHINATLTNK